MQVWVTFFWICRTEINGDFKSTDKAMIFWVIGNNQYNHDFGDEYISQCPLDAGYLSTQPQLGKSDTSVQY